MNYEGILQTTVYMYEYSWIKWIIQWMNAESNSYKNVLPPHHKKIQ